MCNITDLDYANTISRSCTCWNRCCIYLISLESEAEGIFLFVSNRLYVLSLLINAAEERWLVPFVHLVKHLLQDIFYTLQLPIENN